MSLNFAASSNFSLITENSHTVFSLNVFFKKCFKTFEQSIYGKYCLLILYVFFTEEDGIAKWSIIWQRVVFKISQRAIYIKKIHISFAV